MFILKSRNSSPAIVAITLTAVFVLSIVMTGALFFSNNAQAIVRPLVFPVIGGSRYSNDFNAPRASGSHNAIDILANKHQPLVAVVDGTITRVNVPKPSWGYAITIRDADGYRYTYLHMNDDDIGTSNNVGTPMVAYAADMKVGNPVKRGQLIGWVGDSGNSNGVSHLHFEMYDPSGNVLNPHDSLNAAQRNAGPLAYPELPNEILPYGNLAVCGINIAMGNFDGDPASERIFGAGKGCGPHVKIYDDDPEDIMVGLFAYDPRFAGGVDVAAGDVDGDGIDEIITGAGPGGGPNVRVFKLDGTMLSNFFAYSPSFPGGVNVAAGDVDGDGIDEIITGAGPGGGPNVRVFEPNGIRISNFYAYHSQFPGGVDVAAGDVTGTSNAEIITGAGPGGGPHVIVMDKDGVGIKGFFAYESTFPGGVRVSVGDARTSTAKEEILTIPWKAGGSLVRMFDGTGSALSGRYFLENWWSGWYDVATGYGEVKAAAGTNRRPTVREGL